MSDFHRVLLGIHAAARRLDRDQALLGALGVGAFAYTHQIDSVHRMVTDNGHACARRAKPAPADSGARSA
jgi:ATP-dependent helicase HepA